MRSFRAIFVLIMLLACVKSMGYKQSSMNILVDEKTRNMVIFTPDVVTDGMPLMIVTHGMNQSPEVQYGGDKMYTLIDKEKFIIAYLRSASSTWDTGGTSDQRFVEQTIGEMYAKYKIDPHRVYWSGFSMGSMLMYHSMHNMTKKIAAFCPCSGIQFSEQPWNKVKGPINLIHCHAKDDSVFPLNQYDVHSYVENMVKVNGESTYTKKSYKAISSSAPGELEIWENADGYKIELYMYQWGDHNPSHSNANALWNFCKNIRLENIDPIPEPEKPVEYVVNTEKELFLNLSRTNSKKVFPTDSEVKSIFYCNSSLDSPQNVRSGSCNDLSTNEFCWFMLTRVKDAKTSVSGNLYTIQIVNKNGETYNLWSNNGYLNTPPGAWCLFALGIKNQYGEDAKNYGLWKIEYEEDKGYVIQNVGAYEAGENSYLSPAFDVPQAEKQYVRFFSELTKKTTGIESVVINQRSSSAVYDLMGQRVTKPRSGNIYICNGKKFIEK